MSNKSTLVFVMFIVAFCSFSLGVFIQNLEYRKQTEKQEVPVFVGNACWAIPTCPDGLLFEEGKK